MHLVIMILVSYNYFFSWSCIYTLSMEKSMLKISKSNSPNLSMDHGMFQSYSLLSRCNSFSSSSNDSAVYCGPHSTHSKLKNGKRLASDNQSVELHKRSRNSSGSSVSSNISCVSDKDLKSRVVPTQITSKSPIKDNPASSHEYSNKSNDIELKEETIQSGSISPSNEPTLESNQRTLRRKITKKGCACCPSTHATVFVRRYHEIYNTEKKTVISSTKVKTYVQKGSMPNEIQSVQENDSSPKASSMGKRRKSEIEKLYESLHQIEWAKNFSPDNILRQISVRQAASCSVFGRSHTNTENSPQKMSKKFKDVNNFDHEVTPTFNNSSKSENKTPKSVVSTMQVEPNTNMQHCNNKFQVSGLQAKQITSSNNCVYQPNYKSCNSQSSVNITCSVSHVNVKEININSTNSVHHSESLLEPNSRDCDDAQLSYTSDESSSASNSIVNLQSKHLLDLDYNGRTHKNSSDADASEYSTAPTFFDIAEEGIRTIDACFREVGAEVVVSTCYDDSSIPSLTSIIENGTSNKSLADDGPPVLEPYSAVSSNLKLSNSHKSRLQRKAKDVNSKKPVIQNYSRSSVDIAYNQNLVKSQEYKKCYSYLIYRSHRDLLLMRARKRILKKYWKQLYFKSNAKCLPKIESDESSGKYLNNAKESNVKDLKFCNVMKENKFLGHYQNPKLPTPIVPLDSASISSKTEENETNKDINKGKMYSADKLIIDCMKNGSRLYSTVKVLNHPKEFKNLITPKVQTNVPEQKSGIITSCSSKVQADISDQKPVISSFSKTKVITSIPEQKSVISKFSSTSIESDNKINKEPICRPLQSFGLSCSYNSIRVNRSNNYTQIILKLTRGKSIFLTVEALTELRDALIRSSHDTGCQVLILNGIGESFCLGVDIKQLVGPRKKLATVEMAKAVKGLIEALSDFKKPVAIVVNGPALGLGMTLLNHADISLASEKATFCMPHSFLGYMPEGGATLTLPQIVGSTVAMDLLIRGKTLTAREACNVGLISEVIEAKHLPHELVSRVRMLTGSSISALETTKALLKMQLHVNLQLVLENEIKLLPCMWLNQTCQDAMRKALHSGILSE